MPIENDHFAPHIIYGKRGCLKRHRRRLFQQELLRYVLIVGNGGALFRLPRCIPIRALLNKPPVLAPTDDVLRIPACLCVRLMKLLNRLATIGEQVRHLAWAGCYINNVPSDLNRHGVKFEGI
jgi:hypothetical protein